MRDDRDHQDHREQPRERFLGKGTRILSGFQPLCEDRHEGGVERAFGKEPAKGVREPESGIEGVGYWTGAERCRHEHLAREAENAAHQRSGRDRGELFDQTHLLKNLCCGLR